MKNIIFFVVIVVFLITFKSVIGQGILNSDDFLTPPDHAKVHVWWHWIQGAISKEGITKDLESMKDQGVGQATIFNIGLLQKKDFYPDRILFRSPEWYAMFRFALEEADRLGIKIGINNCDGWATSGGPWVKPENSMKQFVWTETIVEEGDNSKIFLQKPKHKLNYYEDIAVLAVKNNGNISAFQRVKPKVYLNKINTERHLFDGCPFTGYEIKPKDTVNLHFENAITANKIAIHLYKMQLSWGNDPEDATTNFKMQFSNDNKHFQTLDTFKLSVINETSVISIPDIKAKYLRLIFNKTPKSGQHAPPYLTEVELLQDNENPLFQTDIPYYCAKIGICNVKDRNAFDISQENLSKKGLKRSEIINVSQYINEAGELNYSLPAGNWSIIRFGYTTTGKENSPATAEGTGLEVDKMDTTALNEFFAGFPQQLIEHAGNYTGNTFKFLLIDSWEANLQNWTNEFPKHFEKGRAYDIISWIPALCGKTVEDNRQTEAFLYDFRLTIADLIEQNYYKHFRTLCYRNKLEFHAEVIYGGFRYPSLDVIKTNSYTDMPMMEYWTSDINNGKI
ncbi:MAG: glycosyl hydrolase, partial [Cyclobacteriaceae bacterium]